MTNKALMDYRLKGSEIGIVEEASTIFLNARNQIDKKYDGKITCKIYFGIAYNVNEPIIKVKLSEREKGSLEPALRGLFSEVGIPTFVNSGSNYDLINSVLQKHNKKLQRKFKGGGAGKHVVDLSS